MAQKMLYVKDEDLPVFEEAQQLGGESLSAVVAEALRRFVDQKRAEAEGYEEVTVKVGVEGHQRTVRFVGRLLAETRVYCGSTSEGKDRWRDLSVYRGRRGKLVVVEEFHTAWQSEKDRTSYAKCTTEDLRTGSVATDDEYGEITIPDDLLDEVEAALGREVGEVLEV